MRATAAWMWGSDDKVHRDQEVLSYLLPLVSLLVTLDFKHARENVGQKRPSEDKDQVSEHLNNLETYTLVIPDGTHPQMLRELAGTTNRLLFITF